MPIIISSTLHARPPSTDTLLRTFGELAPSKFLLHCSFVFITQVHMLVLIGNNVVTKMELVIINRFFNTLF